MSSAQDAQPQRGCILAVGKGMGSKEYHALEVISAMVLGRRPALKSRPGAMKMALQVKAPAVQPGDQSSIPRIRTEKERPDSCKLCPDYLSHVYRGHVHSSDNKCNFIKIEKWTRE